MHLKQCGAICLENKRVFILKFLQGHTIIDYRRVMELENELGGSRFFGFLTLTSLFYREVKGSDV